MKKRIINAVLISILIASLGITCYLVFDYYYEKKLPTYDVKQISKDVKKYEPIQKPIEEYKNELPKFREEYNNEYIKGRLRIPSIGLDLLVTRTDDNSYFLERNIYGDYDGIGTAIFDFRNVNLITSKQINIYGHNSDNPDIFDKVPFKKIEAYTNENTFKNAQDIYLDLDEKKLHYKLSSVKISEKYDNEHMYINFNTDDEFQKHINYLQNNSLFINDTAKITKDDKVLIIQTCNYNPPDTFLILIAKEINE